MFIGALVHSCGWTLEPTATDARDATGFFSPVALSQEPWVIDREWLARLMRARERMS
jgi:hypothetical protein